MVENMEPASASGAAEYKSGALLVARQAVLALLVTVVLVVLAVYLLRGERGVTPVALAIGFACILPLGVTYVARAGFVRVTVTDAEVVVAVPGKRPMTFDRGSHVFSSRVETHSVNLIPVRTDRILIVADDRDVVEVPLPNLTKKDFDKLVASLRAAQVRTEVAASGVESVSFAVPKEAMLADYRAFVKRLLLGGAVVCVGLVAFFAYLTFRPGAAVGVSAFAVAALGCVFIVACFIPPVLMEYRKRQNRIPETVAVDADRLRIGADVFDCGSVRRVVATPPAYGDTDWSKSRVMVVETDYGKKSYHFGVRRAGGIWKTAFAEYGDMCLAIEKAGAASGFELVYDL